LENTRRIEEAALNAWPALQQILYDGWVLRFSQGYTKRANSINPVYPAKIDIGAKVKVCEDHYQRRNLPPIFRLTSFLDHKTLDAHLVARGYQRIDPTLVIGMDLSNLNFETPTSIEIGEFGFEDWFDHFSVWSETDSTRKEIHQRLLKTIPSKTIFASVRKNGKTVACGLGVVEDQYVGIFDLITSPEMRCQGYGTHLMNWILSEAKSNGVTYSYLQVMETNKIARKLYQKIGYEPLYHYWYRVLE